MSGVSSATMIAGALSAATAGMSILGSANQAGAQQQAGQVAYQNALLRNQAAQMKAQQERAAAIAAEATGQRADIEAQRRGNIMASRARAVMAASGAGVDPKLVASLVGEGQYAGSVQEFNAGEKARADRNQASLDEWAGNQGLILGGEDASAMSSRASNTLLTGIAGVGLSLADKYGGPFKSSTPAYSLSADTARTAGDADLGGYNHGVA